MEREEGQVENWNDDRLDELSRRMDSGFSELKKEMKDGFARVDRRFERIDDRLDKLIFATWATGGAFAATAFAALVKVAFF